MGNVADRTGTDPGTIMDLAPPNEHNVLVFLAAFGVLLVAARGFGALAKRFGQPAVIGELGAGLVLGPSLLGRVAPDVEAWLFPPDAVQTAMLFTVAWLGVIFLLVVTGFETDLGLIRRLGRAAGVVSTGSLVVPIAGGLAVGALMPATFLGSDDRVGFALFMGAALSISSLPVIAKILTDMGYLRRDFGQLTLAAGMANDVVGWIALGVISGMVSAGVISLSGVGLTLLGVGAFFVVAFTVGQRLVDLSFRALRRHDADPAMRTTVLVVLALAAAVATQWLGVEAVLGAFVAGILVGRSPFRDAKILDTIETATTAFLAPVFFASAGLRVDLGQLTDPTVLVWGLVIIVVASATKFLGAVIGGTIVRLPGRESTALGIGLNARGALEIVIASVGLSLGVLNGASYTVVVLMAMATSMMAPPLLRRALRDWPGTDAEQARLKREEALAVNLVVRTDRVLVPSRGGPQSMLAAQILDLAWPSTTEVSVLAAGPDASEELLVPIAGLLGERSPQLVVRAGADVGQAVIAEAKLGYGAIVIGLETGPGEGEVPEWVTEVIARTQIPVVLVRRPRLLDRRTPWAFGRALVPVSGGARARAAQEIAFGISSAIGTDTVIAHVAPPGQVTSDGVVESGAFGATPATTATRVGEGVLGDAFLRALSAGARVQTIERVSASPAEQIVALAREVAADVVIIGATRRTVGDGQFLGATPTEVLRHCDATVVVVVLPESSNG